MFTKHLQFPKIMICLLIENLTLTISKIFKYLLSTCNFKNNIVSAKHLQFPNNKMFTSHLQVPK